VLPDEVKTLAVPVLAHRVLLDTGASVHGLNAVSVIERIAAASPCRWTDETPRCIV
jgi:MoxR-like ATPase